MDKPLKLEEIAIEVGRRLGRKPPTPQAVGKWLSEGQEPDSFDVVRALAETLRCDPSYLAFGDSGTLHSEKPNVTPDQPDIIDRSDYAGVEPGTAKRVAEAKKPAVKRAAGGKGKR